MAGQGRVFLRGAWRAAERAPLAVLSAAPRPWLRLRLRLQLQLLAEAGWLQQLEQRRRRACHLLGQLQLLQLHLQCPALHLPPCRTAQLQAHGLH